MQTTASPSQPTRSKFARRLFHTTTIYTVITLSFPIANALATEANPDILSLTFEQLMQLKISSVAKREQPLGDAAASIYVITHDMIRNSGVTTLPEALRLDPRLQVSRIDGSQYAIGIRGFTTDTNNKLLVLIDGRTVYTSLFSGVFWDHQDVLLEDVERIEVISGPGATLWGTNAVNGVINIITRGTDSTTGWMAASHSGNFERGARMRYGTPVGPNGDVRVYGKFFEADTHQRNDGTVANNGTTANDGAERLQTGFRADWKFEQDKLTVIGDAYVGKGDDRGTYSNPLIGTVPLEDIEVSGHNILARWQHAFAGGAELSLQAYRDYFKRRDAILFQPEAETWDLDLQYALPLGPHRILWGGGYRYSEDKVDHGLATYFRPDSRSLDWTNVFSMTELRITDALEVTVGLRLEHNDFTGMEYLPTLRTSWKHDTGDLTWASISRAVRAPARFDRDVFYGIGPDGPWFVQGGPNFVSEVANVFEIGHRGNLAEKISYSIAAYCHDWDRLRSATAIPVELENQIEGNVYGIEYWVNYQAQERWQLAAGGTRLVKKLHLKPNSQDPVGVDNVTLSNDADYQAQIRSTLKIQDLSTLQIAIRHVAELTNQGVPSYTAVDANYIRQLATSLTLNLRGQNLLDNKHYEYGDRPVAVVFGRSIWLELSWEPE